MTIDELAAGKCIALTTYKSDGTPVSTPVWVTRDGDALYVITDSTSGKVKRLRKSSRARVAPCDMRGNVTGDAVDCTAELLDARGTATVNAMIDKRYGLMAKAIGIAGALRAKFGKGSNDRIGIRITLV